MEAGADAYIMKPIRAEEVRGLWQHCFRRRALASKEPSPSGRAATATGMPSPRASASKGALPSARSSALGAPPPPGSCNLVLGPRPGGSMAPAGSPSALSPRRADARSPGSPGPTASSPGVYSRCRRPGNTNNRLKPIHVAPPEEEEDGVKVCAQQ